ncbi:Prx [Scenedesmus sp. PABB004]|nr:Prx [Scenedesmus sp. PABB004]
MARALASAALVLLLAGCAAAWRDGCTDVVVGETGPFGIVGETKPMAQVDQTEVWQANGWLTKVELFYSWNFGCLQGIRATYGAGDGGGATALLGHTKNLYTQDLALTEGEHLIRVDVRQAPNKCVEFVKLTTSKGNTLVFGNAKSTSEGATVIAPKGSWFAAFKGEHDLTTVDGQQVQAGLQNFRMVWAMEDCPTVAPPAEPVPKPDEPEAPAAPAPAAPVAPPPPAACPAAPSMCSADAAEGARGFCPVVAPFTAPECAGGCCVSSGKCKLPLCKLNGLGSDVMALDFICYAKNDGPFGLLNKCRDLACKLAVPGCKSHLLGGNCVGTVVAAGDDVDDQAKQYLGMPCLETVNLPGPLHLPLTKPGLPSASGEYVSGLWTVCDCDGGPGPSPVLPALPSFDLKSHLLGSKLGLFAGLLSGKGGANGSANGDACHGPLCALLPALPGLNVSLPDLHIPMALLANITSLMKPKPIDLPALAGLVPAIALPHISFDIDFNKPALTLPDLPTFEQCAGYLANITTMLKPAIEAVLPTAHPLSPQDLVGIVTDLLPQIRFELPSLDVTKPPPLQLPDLTNLVGALLPKIPQFPNLVVNFPELRVPEFKKFSMPKLNFTVPDIDLPNPFAFKPLQMPKLPIVRFNLTLPTLPTKGAEAQLPSLPKLPDLTLPSLPAVELPKLQIPDVALPTVMIPTVQVPDVSLPKPQLPTLNVAVAGGKPAVGGLDLAALHGAGAGAGAAAGQPAGAEPEPVPATVEVIPDEARRR